ncbi:amino acid adenylation domain-containing protein [Salibacterium sp. K-3]
MLVTIEGYELSNQQKRIWQVMQDQNHPFYNYLSVTLKGVQSIQSFKESLVNVINRHESFSTTFDKLEGIHYPIQIIGEEGPFILCESNPPETGSIKDDNEVSSIIDQIKQPVGKMIGVILNQVDKDIHELRLYGHSLNVDIHSLQMLVMQTVQLHVTGQTTDEKDLIQYVDFSQWQDELFEEKHSLDWNQVKKSLPFEYLPGHSKNFEAGNVKRRLSDEAKQKLMAFTKKHAIKPGTVLFTTWKSFLSKVACADVLVGFVSDGRNYDELKPSIGQFEKVLPIELNTNVGAYRDLNKQMNTQLDDIFEKLEYINPSTILKDANDTIPYQFRYMEKKEQVESISVKVNTVHTVNDNYRLLLTVLETSENVDIFLDFNQMGFHQPDAVWLLRQFEFFLLQCLENPDKAVEEMAVISAEEEKKIIYSSFGSVEYSSEPSTIIDQLTKTTNEIPDALAVVSGDHYLTYKELDCKSNRLANYIKKRVRPEERVAISLPRSVDAVISMIASLKAGAAFVPVDPKWPSKRIKHVLEDSKVKVFISNTELVNEYEVHHLNISNEKILADEEEEWKQDVIEPHQLAYVLYTSGTTALPKGVGVEHGNVINYLTWFNEKFSRDVRLPFSSELGFDAFLKQVFLPLIRGEKIFVFSENQVLEPSQFLNAFLDYQCNAINCVPAYWRVLVEELDKNDGLLNRVKSQLSTLFIGGEKMGQGVLKKTWALFPDLSVVNLYGPTETTANATFSTVKHEAFMPIGSPIDNMTAYVLKENMEFASIGEEGELYIGGLGVARGYIEQAGLTAERYIPNPFSSGDRLYKTGDIVRLMANGQIEFLYRADDQLKINGKRVDLNEIETLINQHPYVLESVVLITKQLLVTFFVGEASADVLRAYAKEWLPDYMEPTHFIEVTTIPLTINGKIDKQALVNLHEERENKTYIPPRNEMEEVMIRIWGEVLNTEELGIRDNFFELGGHSLNATQIISRLRKVYELDIPVSLIFETEIIEELCEAIKVLHSDEVSYIDKVSHTYLEAEKMTMAEEV